MRSSLPKIILWTWLGVAMAVLSASVIIYISSLFHINVMEKYPVARLLYLAIFPPVIAALLYCRRFGGRDSGNQERVLRNLPRWVSSSIPLLVIFSIVNFAVAMILAGGGEPVIRGGRYFLVNNNRELRSLTHQEFETVQSYNTLGLSGVMICFAYAAVVLLIAVQTSLNDSAPLPRQVAVRVRRADTGVRYAPAYGSKSFTASIMGMAVYVGCVVCILSGKLVLSAICVVPAAVAAAIALRQRWRDRSVALRTTLGCLSIIPNAFIGAIVAERVAKWIYIVAYVGLRPAISGRVTVEFARDAPAHLSTGAMLNTTTWAVIFLTVQVPVFAVTTIGLTHLIEDFGALLIRADQDAHC
jgi:hypothetical protein